MLSNVFRMFPRPSFGRQEVLTHHPAGVRDAEPVFLARTPSDAGKVPASPAGEQDRALALLTVLAALAPVTRATFLALRRATGLPDAVLLRALTKLRDAGLAQVEERRLGQSTLAFSISEQGREVLGSPRTAAPARKIPTRPETA
ncbi:MAG: hypothetical protein M3R38_07230 [Actinomycetota bacterium]|nr:hypothetical protein [Actinomycetota bacterium]